MYFHLIQLLTEQAIYDFSNKTITGRLNCLFYFYSFYFVRFIHYFNVNLIYIMLCILLMCSASFQSDGTRRLMAMFGA
jgi:hypothetical protein